MKNTLEEIQHYGITVGNHRRSRNFYSRSLRLPLLAQSVKSGPHCEMMYRLREVVNVLAWYQIGAGGIETFYLPRHPSAHFDVSDIRTPGFRYMAFHVDGFDDFAGHLDMRGIEFTSAAGADPQCIALKDPDGVNILLFDSGKKADIGRISGLKELGLVVADPEGYEQFFDTLGLWKTEEDDPGFISGVFGLDTLAPLYGNVRLIPLPSVPRPAPKRCFPASHAASRLRFCDTGIKHPAFHVHDVDAFHEEGKKNGIAFLFEPLSVAGGSRITYFLDPEGNTFEAMQVQRIAGMAGAVAGRIEAGRKDVLEAVARTLGARS